MAPCNQPGNAFIFGSLFCFRWLCPGTGPNNVWVTLRALATGGESPLAVARAERATAHAVQGHERLERVGRQLSGLLGGKQVEHTLEERAHRRW